MPRKTDALRVATDEQLDASMRPRPDAAENVARPRQRYPLRLASMRPRPDAAENTDSNRRPGLSARCFNEAAARCRGKRTPDQHPAPELDRFNEAAARCRGKRTRRSGRRSSS